MPENDKPNPWPLRTGDPGEDARNLVNDATEQLQAWKPEDLVSADAKARVALNLGALFGLVLSLTRKPGS